MLYLRPFPTCYDGIFYSILDFSDKDVLVAALLDKLGGTVEISEEDIKKLVKFSLKEDFDNGKYTLVLRKG